VDVGKLSLLPNEREVLFFPFSSFEIKTIVLKNDIYEITLLYLAKYVDKYKEDFTRLPKQIPESIFKNELIDSNLINRQDIESTNSRKLYELDDCYKTDVKPNISNKISINLNPLYPTRKINLSDNYKNYSHEKNYITGYFLITERDINQNIRIINSFEESKRRYNYIKVQNELKYNNEKEIMNKCEIEINGYMQNNFVYFVKFYKPGEYIINYKFKSKLNRADFMFAECTKLKHLDLDNFNSSYVTNMSCMFMQCTSLEDLNINKLDTQNVKDMSGMFYGCESLTNIDLSNCNTQNVENMSLLFFGCKSLFDINLLGFKTQNVKDMYCMFSGCVSLSSLNLLNFNTQNVTNMTRMFSDCQTLEELNLSSFYTNKVQYMNSMFSGCSSLSELNLSNFSVENIINLDDMFRGCFSLKLEKINCKNKNFLIKKMPFI
jgi:surface protein